MTLADFILSNTRRFYSSMGNRLAVKGLYHWYNTDRVGLNSVLLPFLLSVAHIRESDESNVAGVWLSFFFCSVHADVSAHELNLTEQFQTR